MYKNKYLKYKIKYNNLKSLFNENFINDHKFWNLMAQYNNIVDGETKYKDLPYQQQTKAITFIKNIQIQERIEFIKKYNKILGYVSDLMFGQHTCTVPIESTGYCSKSLYSKYVGADDGHADLAKYIVRSGKVMTVTFLKDPQSPFIYQLAKQMRTEGSAIDMFDTNGGIIQSFLD